MADREMSASSLKLNCLIFCLPPVTQILLHACKWFFFCTKDQTRLSWEVGVAGVLGALLLRGLGDAGRGVEAEPVQAREEMPRMGPPGGGPRCAAQRSCTKSLTVAGALP